MASIRTQIELYDSISSPLGHITDALHMTVSAFEEMDSAANSSFNSTNFISAKEHLNQANIEIEEMEHNLNQADRQQQNLNNSIQKGTGFADGLGKKIIGIASAYGLFKGFRSGFDRLMGIDTGIAKLEALGHSAGAIDVIMDNAVDSVTGTAFRMEEAVNTAASAVAAGIRPGQQLERYLSLTADAAAIAGTNMSEMGAIFNKVTTSGMIQAQELNQIADRGIPIFQMLADEMGVTAQEVRKLASEGEISADIFLNAVEEGFGGAAQSMGTASFQATIDNIGAAISRISAAFLNGAGDGQGFFDQVKPLMVDLLETLRGFEERAVAIGQVVGQVFIFIYDLISSIVGTIVEYWSIISPFVYGAIAALTLYAGYLAVTNAIQLISTGIQTAYAIAMAVKTRATIADVAATHKLTVAQWALNSALLASPITWIIVGIIAIIALLFAVVARINKVTGSSISAIGIITGALAVAGAFIGNLFIVLINFVIDIFVVLWNFIAAFANFFANVFTDPVGAIARLFFDLVDTVLSLLQSLAKAIDTIFGSNLAGSVQGWRDSLGGWVDDTFGQGVEVMAKMDSSDLHLDRFEYGSAWDAGYSFGEGIQDTISEFDPASLFDTDIPDPGEYVFDDYESGMGSVPGDISDISKNTGQMKDSANMSAENLKYMRDMAEMEVINRYTTAEIKVEMTNNNNINNEMDLDGVVDYLGEGVNEAMERAAEGVHQ